MVSHGDIRAHSLHYVSFLLLSIQSVWMNVSLVFHIELLMLC